MGAWGEGGHTAMCRPGGEPQADVPGQSMAPEGRAQDRSHRALHIVGATYFHTLSPSEAFPATRGCHHCVHWTEEGTEPQLGAGTCLRTQNRLVVWLRHESESPSSEPCVHSFIYSTLIYEVPTMCQALHHQASSPISIYGTNEGTSKVARGWVSGGLPELQVL